MAQRRMFSKTITSSSEFLMMPQSAQNLYFHLGMNSDDDGFCEHFMVMRMTGSQPDDLKVLGAKHFIEVFDDKVLVILDWRENNYLRTDRYTPSKYLKIYEEQLSQISRKTGQIELGIPNVNQMDTQDRLGEDRLGKVNIPKLKKSFWENPLFKKYQKKYPDRDYDLAFEEMCQWYLANKKRLPKAITALGKWLSLTPPDTAFVEQRKRALAKIEQEKRLKEMSQIGPVNEEKLHDLRLKMKNIGVVK